MAVYPNVRAGQRITNDLLTSNEEAFIQKMVTTSRASNIVPAADPELILPVVANATYYVEMAISAAADGRSAGATPPPLAGFTTVWGVPAGTTGLRSCWGPDDTTVLAGTDSNTGTPRQGVHGHATLVSYGTRGNNNALFYVVKERGYIVTVGTAGNISLNWSQTVSNAAGTQVALGSYMTVKRLG